MKRASSDLQISAFSDREIMAAMSDLNGTGDVLASDLGLRLFGLTDRDDEDVRRHATRCVSSRLTWMRRYGLVEKGDEKGAWLLSETGKELFASRLGRSFSTAITHTPKESVLDLAHQVGMRMVKENTVGARAMRRELQHQIMRRKWR
jgi:hypothetical protein